MSSIEIRKASLNDAENIITLLNQFYPGVPNHWRKLFVPRSFQVEDDFPGFVIVDAEKVVGFLGTIFYDHETKKGKVTVCNLTCWYIESAYRQHSMMLFLKVMKLSNISAWTNLTAAPHTHEWFKRAGYEAFVDAQTIILPLPPLFARNKEVKWSLDFTAADLDLDQRSIYQQHQLPSCKHLLISKGKEQCYCIIIVKRYKKIPLANLYYISCPSLFYDVIATIRMQLCYKLHVAYLVLEGKRLNNQTYGIFEKKLFPPRLYKSALLTKEEMTLLGSELFLLGI